MTTSPGTPPPDWEEEREALIGQLRHAMRLLWSLAHQAGGELCVTAEMMKPGLRDGAQLEIIPVAEGQEYRILATEGAG